MTDLHFGFGNGFPRQYTRWGRPKLFNANNIFFRVGRLLFHGFQIYMTPIYVQTSADTENNEWLTVFNGK
jgi:hypothetical protein